MQEHIALTLKAVYDTSIGQQKRVIYSRLFPKQMANLFGGVSRVLDAWMTQMQMEPNRSTLLQLAHDPEIGSPRLIYGCWRDCDERGADVPGGQNGCSTIQIIY